MTAWLGDGSFVPSGDPDIDAVRAQVVQRPTDATSFTLRGFLMKLWAAALQQLGADLEPYLPIDTGMRGIVFWNTLDQQGREQVYPRGDLVRLCTLIDEGFAVLERLQAGLAAGGVPACCTARKVGARQEETRPIPWPGYKGGPQRTGHTGGMGPTRGSRAWRFPIGAAWESRPVIEGDCVYTASPGMRNILSCLDLETGEARWTTKQVISLMGDQWYNTPSIASSLVVLERQILARELGSRGNHGLARHIVRIDKATGEVLGKIPAGHIDYRAGYAPFAADDEVVVYPHGIHDIHETPPVAQPLNRLVCRGIADGALRWDVNIGATFADPVLSGDRVYAGTQQGLVYCLAVGGTDGALPRARIVWQFRTGGAVNRAPCVCGGSLYFGANDGAVYRLDAATGELRWRTQLGEPVVQAFRHFSIALVHDGRVYLGSADGAVYGLDSASGRVLFRLETGNWVRSRPALLENRLYVATLSGDLHCVDLARAAPRIEGTVSLGDHAILADLTAAGDRIVASDANHTISCVTGGGGVLWKRRLLAGFERDGERILTEQIAGGGYFQAKPTAADGLVFCGGPSRFVFAIDVASGREVWKCELGAAVSGAPEYADGRLYIGQQGGENQFYCLDAANGRPLWTQALGWVWGSACVDGGRVFVPGIDGWANCLDAGTGAILWRCQTEKSLCTEPAVWEDLVYFGGWDHFLYAFRSATGELAWKHPLDGSADSGAPVVAGGRLYVPVGGSRFSCLDARTGAELWSFSLPLTRYNVTPAYHDGRVYIGVQYGLGLGGLQVRPMLYALDAVTGRPLWSHAGTGVSGPVVGGDGEVYVASNASPYLYCLDPRGNGDGTTDELFTYRMGDRVLESVPCLYGGRLFILSCDGYLHAVE